MVDALLAQMITVEKVLSSSDSDFLSGTQLDQPGVPGVYTVFAAGTDDAETITITQGSRQVVTGAAVVRRSDTEIREDQDTFYQTVSPSGGRPVINVSVASSQKCRVRVKFLPAGMF